MSATPAVPEDLKPLFLDDTGKSLNFQNDKA
jgi:hypothetical protein